MFLINQSKKREARVDNISSANKYIGIMYNLHTISWGITEISIMLFSNLDKTKAKNIVKEANTGAGFLTKKLSAYFQNIILMKNSV